MRYLTGITDTKLQIEFLKESAPNSKKLAEVAQTYEMAKRYVKAMGPSTNNAKAKDKKGYKKGQGQGQGKSNASTPNLARQLASEGKCLRCGKQKDENHQCKALNWDCKHCGKTGHFPSVCISKANGKVSANNASTSKPKQQQQKPKKTRAKANATRKSKKQEISSDSDSSDNEAVTNTVKA